jgi:hypothetical protein
VLVELDGRAAHPEEWQERDDIRDNAALEDDGSVTLRYGWQSVTGSACEVARQVGVQLTRHGWRGQLRRCGPTCTAT